MSGNGRDGRPTRPELVIDDQERGLFRIHRSAFTDPDILALERERIFDRCWLYAAHESEIPNPGDFLTRRVGGRPVIVTRGRDGKARVLLNSCTHRGAVVCRELHGNAKVHQCFYHGWSFTPEGDVNGIPGEDAYSEAFDRHERRLAQPPGGTSVYRDFIFVNFNRANDVSLDDYLAEAKDYIDLVADQSEGRMRIVSGTHAFSMKTNYKLSVENSSDGYHAPTTHKRYFDYLVKSNAMDKGVMFAMMASKDNYQRFASKSLGNGHSIMGRSVGPWGRPMAHWIPYFGEERKAHFEEMYRKAVERLGEERAHQVCMCSGNLLIFPNLVISDIMTTNVRTFHPVEPGYVEITAWCLAPEEEEPPERAIRLDSFVSFLGPGGFATPDDVEALELCQQGYQALREVEYSDASRRMHGAGGGDNDLQIRSYWRQWARLMNAPEPVSVSAG